jgi:ribosomal protein S18 acetylase RimI-like enzyme
MMKQVRGVTIRDAREDERDALGELTLAAYGEYAERMRPEAWAALRAVLVAALATRETVERIVAEQDGRLVGSVMLYAPQRIAYGAALQDAQWPELRLLAVAKDARGQGIGQALVEECIRRTRLSGARALGLHSSESMQAAIRMYGRLGFERMPEQDFTVDGSELVMAFRRDLSSTSDRDA